MVVARFSLLVLTFCCLSEFVVEAKKKTTSCDLACRNGGTCQRRRQLLQSSVARGARDENPNETGVPTAAPNDAAPKTEGIVPSPLPVQPQQKYGPYCQCPLGFTGSLCEVKFVTCENEQQLCRNGSPCERSVDWEGNKFYHCECDLTKTDFAATPFAQKVCDKASTVFCKINALQTHDTKTAKRGKVHSVGDAAGSSFCNNNGKCKDATDKRLHHAGCDCVDGYTGRHCETPPLSASSKTSQLSTAKYKKPKASSTTTSPRRRRILSVFVFIGIMLLFLMAGVAFLIYHGNRGRLPRAPRSASNGHPLSTSTTTRYRKAMTAHERARIPKEVPISEIELA